MSSGSRPAADRTRKVRFQPSRREGSVQLGWGGARATREGLEFAAARQTPGPLDRDPGGRPPRRADSGDRTNDGGVLHTYSTRNPWSPPSNPYQSCARLPRDAPRDVTLRALKSPPIAADSSSSRLGRTLRRHSRCRLTDGRRSRAKRQCRLQRACRHAEPKIAGSAKLNPRPRADDVASACPLKAARGPVTRSNTLKVRPTCRPGRAIAYNRRRPLPRRLPGSGA